MDPKEKIEALKELKTLLNDNTISQEDFEVLKAELVSNNSGLAGNDVKECPMCDGVLTTKNGTQTCSECGITPLNKDKHKCPNCDGAVISHSDGTLSCMQCGIQILRDDQQECTSCRNHISKLDTWCESCGQGVSNVASSNCRECGADMKVDDRWCFKCGVVPKQFETVEPEPERYKLKDYFEKFPDMEDGLRLSAGLQTRKQEKASNNVILISAAVFVLFILFLIFS